MTDPRHTDPRYQDPHFSDPVLRHDRQGDIWGWIAGIAVVVLVAFMLIVGSHGNKHTAGNAPQATAAIHHAMPPPAGTTGQGSPMPMAPAPHAPAPAPSGK
jgi:hypothetical protein